MWGKHTHVSKVVDQDSTPSKIKCLTRVAQIHCNYQSLMILEDVVGVTDLDGKAVLEKAGLPTPLRLTLRKLLLEYIRLSNWRQLLTEIHQSDGGMGKVQAVIPNTPEAEQMILMMNKNCPAYVGHILCDQGLPDNFLIELFQRLCCPTMISERGSCTWDPDSGILTNLCEASENKNLAELEKVHGTETPSNALMWQSGAALNHPLSPSLTWMKTALSKLSTSAMTIDFLLQWVNLTYTRRRGLTRLSI